MGDDAQKLKKRDSGTVQESSSNAGQPSPVTPEEAERLRRQWQDARLLDQPVMVLAFNKEPQLADLVCSILEGHLVTFDDHDAEHRIYLRGERYVSLDEWAKINGGKRDKVFVIEVHPQHESTNAIEGCAAQYEMAVRLEADTRHNQYHKQPEVTIVMVLCNDPYHDGRLVHASGHDFDRADLSGPRMPSSLIVLSVRGGEGPLTEEQKTAEAALVAQAGGLLASASGSQDGDRSLVAWLAHDFCCRDWRDMHFAIMRETMRFLKETEEGFKTMMAYWEELLDKKASEAAREAAREAADKNSIDTLRHMVVDKGLDLAEAMDLAGYDKTKEAYYARCLGLPHPVSSPAPAPAQ